MIFFLDESVPYPTARLLESFDRSNKIRALLDYFDAGVADVEWMEAVSQWDPKPAIVAGDGRILRNEAELATLKHAALSFVCLRPGWTELDWKKDFAWKIIKLWPSITAEVERAREPTLFAVGCGKQAKVERIRKIAELTSSGLKVRKR